MFVEHLTGQVLYEALGYGVKNTHTHLHGSDVAGEMDRSHNKR